MIIKWHVDQSMYVPSVDVKRVRRSCMLVIVNKSGEQGGEDF